MFVSVTFRDGVPQKARGGYGRGLPLLSDSQVLYVESVLQVKATLKVDGICDLWVCVLNSWKTNTIRRSHLDIKGLGNVSSVSNLSLSLEEQSLCQTPLDLRLTKLYVQIVGDLAAFNRMSLVEKNDYHG